MVELLIGLVVLGIGVLVAIGLPIVSLVRTTRLSRRLDALARRIDELADGPSHVSSGPAVVPTAAAAPRPAAARESATPPAAAAAGAPPPPPVPVVAPTDQPRPGAAVHVDASPPAPPVDPLASALPTPSLEARVGGRWLLYAAIATLLVGTSYFLKYAFDNQWITPGLRIALGALAGLAFVVAGMRLAERGTRFFGQVVVGGGIALLYLTAYAGYHFYAFTSREVAFFVMVGITGLGAWVADRQRAQALAMVALVGGFATPALVGGTRDAQITLFTYVTLLVAGSTWLARRHTWLALPVVGVLLTGLTFAGWAIAHYRPTKWVPTQGFLTLLAALFLVHLRHTLRLGTLAGRIATAVLAAAPVAYHLASLANLAQVPNRVWLLAYLIAFTAVGLALAVSAASAWLRLAVWVAAAVPLSLWAEGEPSAAWVQTGLLTLAAIYGLHLASHWRSLAESGPRLDAADVLLLHGNGLWAYHVIDSLLRPIALDWLGPVAGGLALWHLALAGLAGRVHRDAMLQGVALAFALASIGVAVTFDGPGQVVGWAALGAGLAWLGLGAGRTWMRVAGAVLGAMALVRLFGWHEETVAVGTWPIANVRAAVTLFTIALLYLVARWHATLREPRPPDARAVVAALVLVASLVTVVALTSEIRVYFDLAAWQAAEAGAGPITAGVARREVTISIAWAAYALLLVSVGLRRGYAPVRYFAIVLFFVTMGKVFVIDLAQVGRGYRVVSTLGLGLLLLVASWLYQQLVAKPPSK